MRLSYIVLVVVASVFAYCEGASSVSDSERLAVPQSRVQAEQNSNRFLRVHQDDEERAGVEKILTQSASKLKRTVSNVDEGGLISKLWSIRKDNDALFHHIETVMRLDPDGMLLRMRDQGNIDLKLLKHFTKYWAEKYPDWVSKLP
ncbi:hypothetical protein DVH05_012432 [Phytophthora capsici]|nr:hypothetical protein DVH05_012432 [Phytophthora capsici]